MCPARLNEIEMVGLRFARESARQDERWRHAVGVHRFEARWYASIREIDSRAAVQRIEPVSWRRHVTRARAFPNKQPAALIGSGGGERLGLRGPLPASRGIKVGPPGERSADL